MSEMGGFFNTNEMNQVPHIITTETDEEAMKEISVIEKNKSLAKCGRGVLSLTADENSRLTEILNENIDESAKCFGGNKETCNRLKEINDQLQNVAPSGNNNTTEADKKRPGSKLARLRQLNRKLALIKRINEER